MKPKKREEKLKKTRNKINPLSQKDFEDNNISILFSKLKKKALTLILKIKPKMKQYKDSMFSIYINNSQNENEDKKEEKKGEKRSKMRKKMT